MLARAWGQDDPRPSRCWLEFELPGADRTIVARAALVRERRRAAYQLMAFQFAALAPSHRRLIADFADHAPRLSGVPNFLR